MVGTKEVWRRRPRQNFKLETRGNKIESAADVASAAKDIEGIGIGVQRQCIDLKVYRVYSCSRQLWTVEVTKVAIVSEDLYTAEVTNAEPNGYIFHWGSSLKQNSCLNFFAVAQR
jgi:hypothetical protein